MSRELDILAKEYQSKKATVLRKDLNLYQTSITTAASSFLRDIDQQCKKEKQSIVRFVAVIDVPDVDPHNSRQTKP